MGVYQLVTLQPGFLHVHLFDRLGIKPEHLLPLEIPCNDAQAIGAGFLKSLQNKGSSVSQPIWKWFTGSVIWSKNTFLKLNSNWAFDFMNEPWIYYLVLWTHSFFQISIFEPRTLPLTGNALYILNQQRSDRPLRFSCDVISCAIGPTSFQS